MQYLELICLLPPAPQCQSSLARMVLSLCLCKKQLIQFTLIISTNYGWPNDTWFPVSFPR